MNSGDFGPWMLVQRNRYKATPVKARTHPPPPKVQDARQLIGAVNAEKAVTGSRYEIIADMEEGGRMILLW